MPRGSSTAHAFRRERYRSVEGDRRWELTVYGARARTWRLQASLATLEHPFVPCAVEFDGQALPASDWSYDADAHVLRATWHGSNGRLVVEACS